MNSVEVEEGGHRCQGGIVRASVVGFSESAIWLVLSR